MKLSTISSSRRARPSLSGRRHVDSTTRGQGDTCERRGVDLTPKASNTHLLRNRWRGVDGITVAKTCVAFLIAVLVLALLTVAALDILTDGLGASRRFGPTEPLKSPSL
jgi:hypothetical protein